MKNLTLNDFRALAATKFNSSGKIPTVSFDYPSIADGVEGDVWFVRRAPVGKFKLALEYNSTETFDAENSQQINIAGHFVSGDVQDVVIDWGDGTSDTGTYDPGLRQKMDMAHTYEGYGNYVISVTGGYADLTITSPHVKAILDWGDDRTEWISLDGSIKAFEVPDYLPANINNADSMFLNCSNFNSPNVSTWDTSNVTDMYAMFNGCTAFNQDLSNWDTSQVTDMSDLFNGCTNFNQDLSSWDTAANGFFYGMFQNCSAFNQPLNTWDIRLATELNNMFNGCTAFNQPLDNWDTSNITNMESLFANCVSFVQDISNWDISKMPLSSVDFDLNTSELWTPALKPQWPIN